ncbi:hypothetical protein [Halomonas sp.]|uniref:hypothetical protein n=1 Tax=Halomonas sp. TaxID=1486246 RepID=UPI003568EAA3
MRRFRELDDAFSEALRQLDDPDNSLDIPTGPPVRSLATLEREEQEERKVGQQAQQERQQLEQQRQERQRQEAREKALELEFERRLHELMGDYAQSAESVSRLLVSLESRESVD